MTTWCLMVFAPLAQVARLLCCQRSLASQILGTCEVRLRRPTRREGFQLSRSIQVQPFKRTYIFTKKIQKGKTVLSISFYMPLIKVVTNNLGYLGFSIEYSPREKVPLEIDIKRPVYMSFTYAARYRYSLACKLQLACLSNGSWTKLCGLGVCWLVVGWGALCDSSIQATSK